LNSFLQLKTDIEQYAKVNYPYLKAVCFRRQSIAGSHYIVKVNVGTNEYIHVKFFRPLPCVSRRVKFVDVQLKKQRNDQITAF
jgi:cystatin-A/B